MAGVLPADIRERPDGYRRGVPPVRRDGAAHGLRRSVCGSRAGDVLEQAGPPGCWSGPVANRPTSGRPRFDPTPYRDGALPRGRGRMLRGTDVQAIHDSTILLRPPAHHASEGHSCSTRSPRPEQNHAGTGRPLWGTGEPERVGETRLARRSRARQQQDRDECGCPDLRGRGTMHGRSGAPIRRLVWTPGHGRLRSQTDGGAPRQHPHVAGPAHAAERFSCDCARPEHEAGEQEFQGQRRSAFVRSCMLAS